MPHENIHRYICIFILYNYAYHKQIRANTHTYTLTKTRIVEQEPYNYSGCSLFVLCLVFLWLLLLLLPLLLYLLLCHQILWKMFVLICEYLNQASMNLKASATTSTATAFQFLQWFIHMPQYPIKCILTETLIRVNSLST